VKKPVDVERLPEKIRPKTPYLMSRATAWVSHSKVCDTYTIIFCDGAAYGTEAWLVYPSGLALPTLAVFTADNLEEARRAMYALLAQGRRK